MPLELRVEKYRQVCRQMPDKELTSILASTGWRGLDRVSNLCSEHPKATEALDFIVDEVFDYDMRQQYNELLDRCPLSYDFMTSNRHRAEAIVTLHLSNT